jgi:hypothetical protein
VPRLVGSAPLTDGPFKRNVIDEGAIIREFLEAFDWDTKTAKPSKKKLIELGMEDVIKAIYP